jgi:hypothetical protein
MVADEVVVVLAQVVDLVAAVDIVEVVVVQVFTQVQHI